MHAASWENEILAAFQSQGKEFTAELRELMYRTIDPATMEQDELQAVKVTNAMERHFWKKVVERKTFGDERRIEEVLGKSVDQNYGLTVGPFLDLARTYWTYQIEVDDLFPWYSNQWISKALKAVEVSIRALFFPMAGPMRISASTRRAAQKEYLEQFAPELDIEHLLNESTILNTDKKSGHLMFVIIIVFVVAGAFLYLFTGRVP